MNKDALSASEKIEYYLGKDHLPNLHWQAEIPATWEIPPRHTGMKLCNPEAHDTVVTLAEGIPYRLNNLGYRADFDFIVDELKTKQLILVVGDSDTFGRGLQADEVYPALLQKNTDYTVVNLGVSGLSADGMARIGTQAILALGSAVKHVCVLWPGFSSREFVSKDFKCGVPYTSDYLPYPNWTDHIDWVSNNYNYRKNKLLLQQTTLATGAEFHDLMVNREDSNVPLSYNIVTSGPLQFQEFDATTHSAIANYFFKKITKQPSLFQSLQS